MRCFVDLNRDGQCTEYARCIKAKYNNMGNGSYVPKHKRESSGVLEMEVVKVKDGTAKGYTECKIGGVIDVAYPTSDTRRGRVQDNGETCGTIDTGSLHGLVEGKYRIRKLTPKECYRLQGFPDVYFKRSESILSDCQLYKTAGNSVTVNVIYEIAKKLKNPKDI